MDDYLHIARPVRSGNRVELALDLSPALAPYFRERTFWTEYPADLDLNSIPDAILTIPAVGALAPITWATGAALRIDTLDAAFADSLAEVAAGFQALYPALRSGEVAVSIDDLVQVPPPAPGGRGLLFSGGLDSHASLVDHNDEITDLFSIWGADVPTRDVSFWENVLSPVLDSSPPAQGKRRHVLKTNVREALEEPRLNRAFGSFLPNGNWWGALQHGLALTTATAAVAYAHGVSTLYVAASFAQEFDAPWGSNPRTDNLIAWSGTRVSHDGADRTRQRKVHDILAPYVRAGHTLVLASCYKRKRSGKGLNCGECEKCLRTQVSFLVEGIDPNDVGFEMDDLTLVRGRARFQRYAFPCGPNGIAAWEDVASGMPFVNAAVPDIHGSYEFFDWLRGVDWVEYDRIATPKHNSQLMEHSKYFASRVVRMLPPGMQDRIRRATQ